MKVRSIALKYLKQVSLIGEPKIFCISFQRTGTTSVGKFFKEHNFNVATYAVSRRNDWTLKWFKGDYESIFKSLDFKAHQLFEDDPWWCLDFYKVLYHRFPTSKFILFGRSPDRWFDSMINHSKGKTLGNTHRHSKLYRREAEYYNLNIKKFYGNEIDNLLPLTEDNRFHYTEIYQLRIKEIRDFFNEFDNSRLFYTCLEDPDKWQKMGEFFKINVKPGYDVHVNKTKA